MQDLPNPVADDAPEPHMESGGRVQATYRGMVAFDHDGERYCAECVNPGYADVCLEDETAIPHGGPVPSGSEIDCPGASCGNCLRRIEGFTVLHYDGVCQPEYCPDMAVEVADPDGLGRTAEAALLERDGGDVRIMLKEDFPPYGESGDTSWIPESDLR